MGFLTFLKKLLLDGKNGMLHFRTSQGELSPALQKELDRRNAVLNVKRIVPFSLVIFLIELCNQITIFMTDAYPALHLAYLVAGATLMVGAAVSISLAYRLLKVPLPDARNCKTFYRGFWAAFTVLMLVFIYLEITSRGLTNNFFYLLILTAAFPLLSWQEALCLFGVDTLVTIPTAVLFGFSPQQLLQLPLITMFALILSRILYSSHLTNEIMLEQLEITNQKLAALAQTDPLTGLLNRRGIQVQLQESLAQRNKPCTVAFLMIDIDFFKPYNDHFGHDQGDRCLQKVADALQRCVRSQIDFAARIGGEEFLVVLIGCESATVIQTAQRLRREVQELEMIAATDVVHHFVTVSVGIATTLSPINFTSLYGQADRALYKAKNAGRNCVAQDNIIYPNE